MQAQKLFLFFIFSSLFGFTQSKLSKLDFAFQYQKDAIIKTKHVLVDEKDSIGVYLLLTLKDEDKRLKLYLNREYWYFEYKISSSYETKKGLYNANIYAKKMIADKNNYVFYFRVPKLNESNQYLFIYVYEDDDYTHIHDVALQLFDRKLYSNVLILDDKDGFPIFNAFANKKDTIYVKTNSEVKQNYFKFNFQPALPPMATVNNYDYELKLTPDSSISYAKEYATGFSQKGNFQWVDKENNAKNLLIIENKYPKVSRLKELADPIIYIATDDERKNLKNAQKPKQKLDDFWLDLVSEKEAARALIKNYYQRVSDANSYFTCHKEGWKTDIGMVYIVFGNPDEVYKTDYKEIWTYKKSVDIPALRFIFEKKLGPFGDYYFELANHPDYASGWYTKVEQWRKGLIEN